MAQHVGVNLKIETSRNAGALYHLPKAARRKWCATLRHEDERRCRCLFALQPARVGLRRHVSIWRRGGADVVEIPGPDDDCGSPPFVNVYSPKTPQKWKRQTGPIPKLLKSLVLPTGIEPVFQP
jgi:hypothetical protein